MRMILRAAALALIVSLGGCLGANIGGDIATIDAAMTVLNSQSVTPKQVYVAGETFVGLEKTWTNYLRLQACPATPVCRDSAMVKKIDPIIRAANPAVARIVAYAKSPSGPVPVSDYNIVVAAIDAIRQLLGGQLP